MSAEFTHQTHWTCDRCGFVTVVDRDDRNPPEGWQDTRRGEFGALCPPCVAVWNEIGQRHQAEDEAFWTPDAAAVKP